MIPLSTPEAALKYTRAGLSVVPIEADGTKRPLTGLRWKEFQQTRPTEDQVKEWFADNQPKGIGIILGSVSKNLEVLDIENKGVSITEEFFKQLGALSPKLAEALVVVETPSGGAHVYFRRVEQVPGGRKLALSKDGVLLAETRGQGNYVLAPGSHANAHPTRQLYVIRQGDIAKIPILTNEQYDDIMGVIASFDERREPERIVREPRARSEEYGRPGDDFNDRADWYDILTPHGWTTRFTRNGVHYLCRPGKKRGISASLNYGGSDLLFNFSASVPELEPNVAYTKFAAYTFLNHGGDFAAAARALRAEGYGADDFDDNRPAIEIGTFYPEDKIGGSEGDTAPLTVEVAQESAHQEWEVPILFDGEQDTPDIPSSVLPSPIREHVDSIASFTQTPTGLGVMLALSVIATALQRKVVIAPAGEGYTEPLSIWTVSALPPGSRKSQVLSKMTDPLRRWEQADAQALASAIRRTTMEREVLKRQVEDLKKKASTQRDDMKRNELLNEALRLEDSIPEEIRIKRLFTGDVTAERLQGMLVENNERMSVISDEGGIFDVLTGLYNDGRANFDVILQSWSGSPVRVDRGQRMAVLEAPALSFGLTVQPGVISRLSRAAGGTLREKGGIGRFLMCLPKSNIGKRDLSKTVPMDIQAAEAYSQRLTELLNIPDTPNPRVISFSADARVTLQSFAQEIENRQDEGGDLCLMQDWSAKLVGQVIRLAGLMQLAKDPNSCEVDQASIDSAIRLGRLLIEHARYAFDLMSNAQEFLDAKYLAAWLRKRGTMTVRKTDMHNLGRFKNAGTVKRLELALRVLQQRNILGLPTLSRPVTYSINPAFMDVCGQQKENN